MEVKKMSDYKEMDGYTNKLLDYLQDGYFDNKSHQDKLAAVKEHWMAIKNMTIRDDTLQIAAVEEYPGAIQYIKNPDYAACEIALWRDPFVIQYIDTEDFKLQAIAIAGNPSAFLFIDKQNEFIKFLAINLNPLFINHIQDPNIVQLCYALSLDMTLLRNGKLKPKLIELLSNQFNFEPTSKLSNAQLEAFIDECKEIYNGHQIVLYSDFIKNQGMKVITQNMHSRDELREFARASDIYCLLPNPTDIVRTIAIIHNPENSNIRYGGKFYDENVQHSADDVEKGALLFNKAFKHIFD
jgi:hypothetical protein